MSRRLIIIRFSRLADFVFNCLLLVVVTSNELLPPRFCLWYRIKQIKFRSFCQNCDDGFPCGRRSAKAFIISTPGTFNRCFAWFSKSCIKIDQLEFPLNLEYLEAEFFLWGALGEGLDKVAPNLTKGGPTPIGVQKANLDHFTRDIITQFGYQEVGHIRAIQEAVPGFPRPLLNLSASSFAKVVDKAFGRTLNPPFNPFANSLNYLISSYVIPYVGLTGYVGASPKLHDRHAKRLVAGLLAVESAQDAIIRALLYQRAFEKVKPYGITVAKFSNQISALRNHLGHHGLKDEGLLVPPKLGAEGRVAGNVVAGDENSIGFDRTPEEILRIVYGSGDERKPGGFYPKGANGRIAKSYVG